MIRKWLLLARLEDAAELEERGALLLAVELKRRIAEISLPEKEKLRLLEILDAIEEESRENLDLLTKLVTRVKHGADDEY